MARYRRRTTVPGSLPDVWEFHTEIESLATVTPEWMRLRIESVSPPADSDDTGVLTAGSEVEISIRPFGLGPRQSWTSRIVDLERREDVAWFRDRMIDGPFARWIHTHRFTAEGDSTTVTDLVEYELPLVPEPASVVGWPFLEPLFAYRHRRTRRHFEERRSGPSEDGPA